MSSNSLKVSLVAFLTSRNANGGLNSLFELFSNVEGCETALTTQDNSPLLERWRQHSIQTRQIPAHNQLSKLGSLFDTLRWNMHFRKQLDSDKPDLVICNDILALLHAGLAAKSKGIPIVFFIRDVFEPSRPYTLKWRLARSLAKAIICLSQEMASEIDRRLLPLTANAASVDWVYSVINFDRMQPCSRDEKRRRRRLRRISDDEYVIVNVGGFCDKKNQLGLIQHSAQLLDALPNARLYFVGDFDPENDEYSCRCLDAAEKINLLERIVFIGYSHNVSDWYQMADCTLLASRREGLARCMIESLACGTPVVSFEVTSAKEILGAYQCGMVATQGNYRELFASIEHLASDEFLRTDMGGRGIQIARRLFSADKNTVKLRRILETQR